jgi:hypothetical protein
MFKKIEAPAHIFVRKANNHLALKPAILQSILSMGEFSYKGGKNCISSTDWHLSGAIARPYMDVIRTPIADHVEVFRREFGYNSATVVGVWYQRYQHGDFHDWHTHGDCTFSSVYYVELPDSAPKTSFIHNGAEFSVGVEEGDIITFPSYLIHRSSQNLSTEPKTVVAFNLNATMGEA